MMGEKKEKEKEAFNCSQDKNSPSQTNKSNLLAVEKAERAGCLES